MSQAAFHFPRGFQWGTATAAHQVEGNNLNNNWAAWENIPGKIEHGQKAGLACDWWGGRWREDLDRAANAGQNTHRLSIEWSRIQPAPDRWDESALDKYMEILRGLKERKMTAMVTLHHFTNPIWIEEKGGWENEATVAAFEKFTRKAVETLKEYVTQWCTVNEPNVYAVEGFVEGVFPPGKHDMSAMLRVMANLVRGHAAAYHAIHSIQPNAQVGIAAQYRSLAPGIAWSPIDQALAKMMSNFFNDSFTRALVSGTLRTPMGSVRIPAAKNTQDFLGLNYYTRDYMTFDLRHANTLFSRRYFRPDAELSKNKFIANEPEGFFEAMKWAYGYKLPIVITENGVEDPDDTFRPTYLAEHIHQVWKAVNNNYPIQGYYHWSLVDNFEWERGWTQRFGLWEVDPESQARRKRPSADFYAEICRENGLSSDMVARYAPKLFSKLFPN